MEAVAEESKARIRVGVVTVSDRASRGEIKDESGPAIANALRKARGGAQFAVVLAACLPDDAKLISRTLKRWADEGLCDCVLTTGGTGLAERDITPEATEKVLDRTLPYVAMHLALEGVKTVPTAVLSRGVAGTRGRTLIVNLPGSPDGASTGARLLAPIIPHAVALLQGLGQAEHAGTHSVDGAARAMIAAPANASVTP